MHTDERDDPLRENAPQSPSGALALPGADSKVFVTWLLLAINIAVWLLMQFVGGFFNNDVDLLLRFGAMFGPLIAAGEYWRLFTAMFLHAGILHLFLNGFALFIFGRLVEGVYGNLRFTLIYLLAGLAGGVLSYMFNRTAIAVGASGAIFGILGAFAAYFVVHRHALGEMGRQNLTGLAVIAAINLAIGLAIPGIDNWAHFGGLVGGFVMGFALAPRYTYELIGTPYGVVRRIIGRRSIGIRWLSVPTFAALLLGLVWMSGDVDLNDAEQSLYLEIRAERLLEMGDYDGALQNAERAIDMNPRSARALLVRGKIMAQIGSTDRAKSDISASLRLPGLSPTQRDDAISLLVSLP